MLDALLDSAKRGDSRTLVIRGEAGIGKTALLDHVAARANDCRVLRTVAIESEMELPYAAIHQMYKPLLAGLERLPAPQRIALETAFGQSSGLPPDRFFVGVALLSQLSELAESRPLVCLVDDAQWLDRSSAQVLSFVARRLHAESVLFVIAERDGEGVSEFKGLPELRLAGLSEGDAADLVASVTLGPIDTSVRDRIIGEAQGNPLALLELARGRGLAAGLAGGFAVPGAKSLPSRIEATFRHRVQLLPEETQELLLVAAADPVGDVNLLWRAVAELGIPLSAAAPAEHEDLLDIGARVQFRHPLLRSAIYRAASPAQRRAVHQALATATDADLDPDRCAWHQAQAVIGPDEAVAARLEQSAGRAQARGGLAAAAAFLQRSAALTQDPVRRAERALAAAQASLESGAFDEALGLVAAAEAGPPEDLRRARAHRLRAEVAFARDRGGGAPLLLLEAARNLDLLDPRLARDTYLDAWAAALFAGGLAEEGGSLLDVSRAVATAPQPDPSLPCDLLLGGLAIVFTQGRAAAVAPLRRAVAAFLGPSVSEAEMLRWGWLASRAANLVWDYEGGHEIASRAVRLARDRGALEALAVLDNAYGQAAAVGGDFVRAGLAMAEVKTLKEATGTQIAPHAALALEGLRGREIEGSEFITRVIADATDGGQGTAVQYGWWARSVLMNGLGRYEDAVAAAVEGSRQTPELFIASWSLSELIEAATRTGQNGLARDALARLGEHVEGCGTDWAVGVHARSSALLVDGPAAEEKYREAIDRLRRTHLRPDVARAHLLYGEWLRRRDRRVDARGELRMAHDLLTGIGMEAFAERARGELTATGERVPRQSPDGRDRLTAQEAQVAQLASEGLTNAEIAARLFLSPRTVEWHLGKVFTKIGVTSRRELGVALSRAGLAAMPAS